VFAAQITSPHKIELIDVPEAKLEKPGQVIFQPSTTCLCGSDLPFFGGADCGGGEYEYPLKPGLSLHEMVGVVTDTNGTKFQKGDYVLAVPEGQVGFFERYAVSEDRVIPVDSRIPSEEIAVMAQPLGTAIFGLKKIPNFISLDVAIVGQGPMGQQMNSCVRNFGARRIIAIDKVRARLERSNEFGATDVVYSESADPVEQVREITGGRMVDVVIECVGHRDQTVDLCVGLCRHGGRILVFGVPEASVQISHWRDLFFKNITLHTTVNPSFEDEFPLAMQWVAERRIDVARLLTHRHKLADIQTAFETFRDRRDGALKVIVEFPSRR